MCLAVPGKVTKLDSDLQATVDMMGIERQASMRLVPDVKVGDYVLVHAGFGIQVVDPQEAKETIDLLRAMPEMLDGDDPQSTLAGAL